MSRAFKEILAVTALVLSFAATLAAGPVEDANEAAGRGDYATAMPLWLALAEQGNAAAQNNLGAMYDKGLGAPRDYAQAVKWYRLSADQGDIVAQNSLGVMYANGLGVPPDLVRAYMWFSLAAAKGNQGAVRSRDRIVQDMTPDQIAEATKLAGDWKPTQRAPVRPR